METMAATAVPQQRTGGMARRLARLLRRKSSSAGAGMAYSVAGDEFDDSLNSSINSLSKLKLSGNLAAAYTLDAFFKNATEKKGEAAPQTQLSPSPVPAPSPDTVKHAFLASLFAVASALKVAYAQLQLAQQPYNTEAIQAADTGLVAELTKLSSLKRRYTRGLAAAARSAAALMFHAEEQRHLLRTFEITARKMEAELRARDAEAAACAVLADELRAARRFFVWLRALHGRGSHDRRRFFEEFAAAKSAAAAEVLDAGDARWGEFLRDRYRSVVHERMEAAFFGCGAWLGGEFAKMVGRAAAGPSGSPWCRGSSPNPFPYDSSSLRTFQSFSLTVCCR